MNKMYDIPTIAVAEFSSNTTINLHGVLNKVALDIFAGEVVVSYNKIDIKIRPATIDDAKTFKVSSNSLYLGKVDDRHNWIGKFELVQDGDWYVLERIEE